MFILSQPYYKGDSYRFKAKNGRRRLQTWKIPPEPFRNTYIAG